MHDIDVLRAKKELKEYVDTLQRSVRLQLYKLLPTTVANATYQPIIAAGTSAEYYRGDKTFQTLDTDAVAEGNNLYYTDVRAQAAFSTTVTGLDYATGVLSLTAGYVIPTTTEESNWNAAYGWGDHAGLYELINTCLLLDQTTPQTIVNGAPIAEDGIAVGTADTNLTMVNTGDLLITHPANKTTVISPSVYEDLQVSINNIAKGASAPTERFYNHGVAGGVEFNVLGFSKGNYVWLDIQAPHSMKLGTAMEFHIHFTLPNTTNIGEKAVFQLDVLYADHDGTWAVPVGSPFTATHTVAADDNTKARRLTVAMIPAVNTGVSTIYQCKLTRIDGTATEYGSEVYITYMDCHYVKDTQGSRQALIK